MWFKMGTLLGRIKLINSKISEVKNKNFSPSTFKQTRDKEIQEHPERNANITLPFTSPRCEKIIKKVIKIIKTATPLFKVNFCWVNIKLEKLFSPKLKLSKPPLDQNALVYKFTCDCNESYIGETKRRLRTRIADHHYNNVKKPTNNTAVYQHIAQCLDYNELLSQNLSQSVGEEPSH